MVVVLPAPFGPSKASTVPCRADHQALSTALNLPNVLHKPRISSGWRGSGDKKCINYYYTYYSILNSNDNDSDIMYIIYYNKCSVYNQ